MKTRRFLSMLLTLAILISALTIPAMANDDIKVLLNGTELSFDVSPQLISGRTMVPMRKIFEAMGATVDWNDSTQTVTAKKDDIVIIMQIDNTVMNVREQEITLDVPPQLVGGRTLVPVRAVAEGLDADVKWDGDTQTVIITKEDKPVTTPTPTSSPAPTPAPRTDNNAVTFVDLNENTDFTCMVGAVVNYSYNDIWNKTAGTGYIPLLRTTNKAYRHQRIVFAPIYGNFGLESNGQANVTFDLTITYPNGTKKTIGKDIAAISKRYAPKLLVMSNAAVEYEIDDTDELGTYTFTFESKDGIGNATTTNVVNVEFSDYKYTKNEFKSVDELFNYLTYYRENPNPDRVTDAILFAQENNMLSAPVLFFGFNEILTKNPYLIKSTFDELKKKFGTLDEKLTLLKDTCEEYSQTINKDGIAYTYVNLPKTCEDDFTNGTVIGIFMASSSYDAAKILAEALSYKNSSSDKLKKYYNSSIPAFKELIKSSDLLFAYCIYMVNYDDTISQTVKIELKTLLDYKE